MNSGEMMLCWCTVGKKVVYSRMMRTIHCILIYIYKYITLVRYIILHPPSDLRFYLVSNFTFHWFFQGISNRSWIPVQKNWQPDIWRDLADVTGPHRIKVRLTGYGRGLRLCFVSPCTQLQDPQIVDLVQWTPLTNSVSRDLKVGLCFTT